MDEILKTTLLFDFYGELLTERQKQVFEMFHLNDLSLTEIGEELNISRQAVKDQLNRTGKILRDYELKLKLVERFMDQKNLVLEIKTLAQGLETGERLSGGGIEIIEKIKRISDEILK